MLPEGVGEALWLPEDVAVGVGGGVIVLVTDWLCDEEADVDADTLLVVECEVVLEEEDENDNDDDVEPLGERLGNKEGDVDRELLMEAVGEVLWLPEDVAVGVGGGVIVVVIDRVRDGDRLLDGEGDMLLEVEGEGDTDADEESLDDGVEVTELDGDRELVLEADGELLWLPEDVAVGVGGGVIVLVTDWLSDEEADVDADTLLVVECEVVLEEEDENDNDDDGEPLGEWLGDTELDGDREMLLVLVMFDEAPCVGATTSSITRKILSFVIVVIFCFIKDNQQYTNTH